MTYRLSTVERAYELAKSGTCADLNQVKRRLQDEGYGSVGPHLSASLLSRELRALCKAACSQTDSFEQEK